MKPSTKEYRSASPGCGKEIAHARKKASLLQIEGGKTRQKGSRFVRAHRKHASAAGLRLIEVQGAAAETHELIQR